MHDPQLAPLKALVGTWTTEATHPAYPSTVVTGRTTFEWLEGERYLIQRSRTDHPDFPDSIAILGAPDEQLAVHYYDSRGVHRVYAMSVDEGVWRMWREAPGFSQRFTGTFGGGDTIAGRGDTIAGRWQLSRDGSSWDDDLEITFRRAG